MKCPRLILAFVIAALSACAEPAPRPHLESARATSVWLEAVSLAGEEGLDWPTVPDVGPESSPELYSGTSGVVLFFLEMNHATGEDAYLQTASRGADRLLARMEDVQQPGFYTGLAGISFTLEMTYRATGDERYHQGALASLQRIHDSAGEVGDGVEWSPTTDIISGGAGIGLFLIWAAENMDHPESLALAVRAGERLTQQADDTGDGSKWAMNASGPLLYPNFSHGTAGVSYFLSRLYEETEAPRFLSAAVEGGQYLASVANSAGLVFHHEPGGEELFYLGWCHGPAGTSLLFEQLDKLTGDETWGTTVRRSTDSIMASGIPQKQLPGFWNNVGQCCGSAGMGEFFLRLYQQGGEEAYLEFCAGITADIYDRADPETEGLKWVQAEHRVQPELLQAQTGFAQGASGIGLWLLHLDGELQGRQPFVVLPDR